MKPIVPKPQRCAIYTRKSTKFGLQANRKTMFYSTNQKSSVAIVIGKPIPKRDRFLSRDNQF